MARRTSSVLGEPADDPVDRATDGAAGIVGAAAGLTQILGNADGYAGSPTPSGANLRSP